MPNLFEKASIITTPTAYENGKLNSVKPKGGENLLLQSNQFDTTWGLLSLNTPTNGFTGYDGSSDAWKLTTTGSSFSRINQSFNLSGIYTASVYAKKAEWDYVGLFIHGVSKGVVISLIDGTVQNPIINYPEFYADAEDVGNGWYRISIAHTLSGSGEYRIYPCETNVYNGNSTPNEGIYIQDAQLERGSEANTYIETTTTAIKNADFDFTRGSSATRVNEKGLIQDVQILSDELIQNGNFEEEGSELVTNGSFDDASDWVKGGGWSISNGKANCDGTQTATTNFSQLNVINDQSKTYKVEFTLSNYVSGSVKSKISNDAQGVNRTANGTYVSYLSGMTNNKLNFTASSDFIGSIDNVSVKEVGQNWSFGSGWSMEDGKAIASNVPNLQRLQQGLGTSVVGKKYKYSLNITNVSGFYSVYIFGVYVLATSNTEGVIEGEVIATSTNGAFFIAGASASGLVSATIDNVSLIEITDDTDLPRINYTNFDYENGEVVPYSGEGSLLLEPQSTNKITYSEDFSQSSWFTSGVTLESGQISPRGDTSAFKLSFAGANDYIQDDMVGLDISKEYTISFYAKVDSGTTTIDTGNINAGSYEVLTVTDEWQRFQVTQTPSATTRYPRPIQSNGSDTIYLWGCQFEEKSYATSYIPTEGSIKTRLQDICNNAGSSDLINSTEGVLYAEISALANDLTNRAITISDKTSNNRIFITYYAQSNGLFSQIISNGVIQATLIAQLPSIKNSTKVLVKYKQNDFALWVNGFEVSSDEIGVTPIGLDDLSFDRGTGTLNFYGNVKCVAVFKEALSDEELQCLSS